MDNLISETNSRLQEIIDNLTTIKNEYETKLNNNEKEIEKEQEKVKAYKEEFFTSKEKIEKMNSDIEGFEQDYQNLVDRFKDDELANILIAANKEISAKIDERKRKIITDKQAMNELVEKAEKVKTRLVKLTAEKKAFELCLDKILDSYEYYTKALGDIIEYSTLNRNNLVPKVEVKKEEISLEKEVEEIEEMKKATEDNFIVEENEDKEIIEKDEIIEDKKDEFIPLNHEDEIENDEDDDESNTVKLIVSEDYVEEPVIEEEEEEPEATDSIKLIQEEVVEDSNHVAEIAEIPSSLFNFDDGIGIDDEIEDEE